MAFDISEEKVGTEIGGIPVYHLDELEERLSSDIQVAILTVPATVAQSVADRLAETNVHGIFEFHTSTIKCVRQYKNSSY